MPRVIALLTDFGMRDWYVAAMKGVLLTRAPNTPLVDLTHEIPPQDVVAGALTLAAAAPWFPRGTVFLAVVDPGVGTDRAVLAAEVDGCYFIGPDNGLLSPALDRGRRRAVVRVTNRRLWLRPVSRTFHGRDIMAPVAAWLARGGSLRRLGPTIRRITPLPLPQARRVGTRVVGQVIHIDAFGNLITNLPAAWAGRLHPATRRVLWCRRRRAPVVSSYADGRPGQLVAVVGSLGLMELAVRNGSAAQLVRATRGTSVSWG